MRTKRTMKYYLFLIGLFLVGPVYAQKTITVIGKVTELETGASIPGATVLVKNSTNGTTVGIDGKYSITTSSDAILVVSSIGFKSMEVPINGKTEINFSLAADVQELFEVVVVGYGTQSSRDVTGAVQQLNSKELEDIPVPQITQKLQGRLSGVQINQTTGKPGQGMLVRVRGQASILAGSDPLYVIDGFPVIGGISNINPDEIDNISILKDASSTSLYGSRAANGVVLITTKSGKVGQEELSFNYFGGIQTVPQKGRPDLMNAREFAQFKKESYEDLGEPIPEPFQNPDQYGEGYDWYDAMFRTAPIQSYNLTWTSKREKSSLAVIGGFFNQKGVMINSDFKRYSLRVNSGFKLNDKIHLGLSVAPSYSKDNTPNSDGAFYSTFVDVSNPGGLIANAMLAWPIVPFENPDGTLPLTGHLPGISAFPAPNWFRSAKEITNETKTTRILSNLFLEYTPIKDLVLKTTFNVDLGYSSLVNFSPSTASTDFASLPPVIATSIRNNSNFLSWLSENTAVYKKSIGEHNFEGLLGFSIQKFSGDISQLYLSNFPDDRVYSIQSALNIDRTLSYENINEWSLISHFSRLNYNYKGKYLISLAFRRDGSSRFGGNNRWGNFPSISAGWILSDEEFAKNLSQLSFAKLRASYGIVGNNNIGNYTQYALVNNSINAVFGSTIASGAVVTTLGNAHLGWERTKQLDIGIDLGFFNDRIDFTYDYYKKSTTDLLFNVDVPQESGFATYNDNVGEIKFWGHEFAITTRNLIGDLKWNTNLNISFHRNEVVELVDGVDRINTGYGAYTSITRKGEPLGQFWGLVHDGVYDNQQEFDASAKAAESQVGTVKFADINGDGQITFGGDDDDRTVIGNPFPDYIFGITNDFQYKNFDFSIVMSGSVGNDIAVIPDQATTNLDGVFNVLREVKNRWRSPENPGDGKYGKTTAATFMERDWFNSRFIENGSHLTVKNITLGYNFPLKENGILSRARIYGSIQQAFVFTKYKGANPEISGNVSGGQGSALALGYDWSTYPVPRTFTIGANLSF